MSKTRHSKNDFKRALAREDDRPKARSTMSRHPDGTRAKGLGQDYKGRIKVAADRDRFGEAEFQSSRLRRSRRAVLHAARIKRKKELRALLEDLNS